MSGLEIGVGSLAAIVLLIYAGLHIAVALALVSFVGVWLLRGSLDLSVNLLTIAVADSVAEYTFATVPLFTVMGLLVSRAGIGRDVYEAANSLFRRLRGGLGIATVAANALFASVTGSSIASASVFTRVAVPEMRRYDYGKRFAVGVVAGSSVLGMLIPPSVMLIIYAFIAEQSVGQMFIAGILPGLLLATAFAAGILLMARLMPGFVGGRRADASEPASSGSVVGQLLPVGILVVIVLGGIYGGVTTPTEAGALGALMALLIGLAKRRLDARAFWSTLVETGHIAASILFLIITASMYSRMLGLAGLPTQLGDWLTATELGLGPLMLVYVLVLLLLGTILDTASIILIVAPLFLPAVEAFGGSLVWFGIVTVLGAEIGLLTPPLGISCFVIKSTIDDSTISLFDVFAGAFPFAAIMLAVLALVILFPGLSLALL